MFEKTLHPKTKSLLEKINDFVNKKNFYLAGGTALALQLGHRISVDLDFFSQEEIDTKLLIRDLKNAGFELHVQNENLGTLDLLIDDVKVSFLEYKYPLLEDFVKFEKLNVASVLDIACMKVTAISSRGSRKDFYDIWMILEKYSLTEIFKAIEKKYEGVDYSTMHLLKSLTYFDDAKDDPEPVLLVDADWNKVKEDILRKVREEKSLKVV